MSRRGNGQGTLFKRTPGGCLIARWYDCRGKRREKSTGTTDRRAADRILRKRVADAALRKDGVVDASKDGFLAADQRPLGEHVEDYLTHCRHAGRSKKHIVEKARILPQVVAGTGATRFSELSADALENYLWGLQERGLSARTVNFHRQQAVAFVNWAKKNKRVESNPLEIVDRLDEDRDRRRVRRALMDEELARLLDVARPRGRAAWYLCAALAGLRRGDLKRLTWRDIDFDAGTITIDKGKAKRVDVIPLHEQLAEELAHRRDEQRGLPLAKVFSTIPTDLTVRKDLLRAGLARKEPVLDEDGKPVYVNKGRHRRPKMRITTEDAEGRVVDLHALRTMLATSMARRGVDVQVAQRILRHSSYKTTEKHYVHLTVRDTAAAIAKLPRVESPAAAVAKTGTNDVPNPRQRAHQPTHQRGRETARSGANGRSEGGKRSSDGRASNPLDSANLRDVAQRSARKRAKGFEPSTSSLGSHEEANVSQALTVC